MTTINSYELENDMIMSDANGPLRVSNVEHFVVASAANGTEDAVRFDVASLDGSFVQTGWELTAYDFVEIVDECNADLSEEAFLEFLDSVYGDEVQVCGYAMNPGRVLREMDRNAFDQMHNDWTGTHETECGQH